MTTTTLTIAVGDVNDNFPSFEQPDGYERVVEEGDLEFRPPLVVAATDADGPAQGGGKVWGEKGFTRIEHVINIFYVFLKGVLLAPLCQHGRDRLRRGPHHGRGERRRSTARKVYFSPHPPPEKAILSAFFHTLDCVKRIPVAKYFCVD